MNCRAFILCIFILGLTTIVNIGIAVAGPADYVYTPAVEYGEREIDFKYGTATQPAGNRAQVASLGFGYGAKEYWFTEVYFKQERNGSDIANLAEWETNSSSPTPVNTRSMSG